MTRHRELDAHPQIKIASTGTIEPVSPPRGEYAMNAVRLVRRILLAPRRRQTLGALHRGEDVDRGARAIQAGKFGDIPRRH